MAGSGAYKNESSFFGLIICFGRCDNKINSIDTRRFSFASDNVDVDMRRNFDIALSDSFKKSRLVTYKR